MNQPPKSRTYNNGKIKPSNLNGCNEISAFNFEEKLSVLVNSGLSIIIYFDQDYYLHYVNKTFEKTFGLYSSAVAGKHLADVWGSETYYSIKGYIETRLFEQEAYCEWQTSLKNVIRYFEAYFTPDIDNDGNILGYTGLINDITEKKQIEKELKRKQQELQDYVDNAVTSLHWVDGNGIILWANKAELNLLGYTAEEYIGHPISNFHASKEKIEDILKRLSHNEALHQYEAELLCKDGSLRTVLINSNVLWEDGKFIHTRCFTTDITDRKNMLETFKKNEANYKEIFKQAPVSFSICTGPDYKIEFVNEFALKLAGVTQDEMLHKPVFELYPELAEQGFKQVLDEVYTKGNKFIANEIAVYFHKQGEVEQGWFNVVIEPFRDPEGKIIGIISMSVDVTEQVVTRKKIEDKEKFQRTLLESLPHAVYSCDKDGFINYYNEAAIQLWGCQPKNDEQLKYCAFKHVWLNEGTLVPADQTPMSIAVHQGKAFRNIEAIFETFDNRKFSALVNITPLFDEEGNPNGAINIFQDITERKRTENALSESEQSYRNLIQGLPAAIYTTDKDGIITLYNEAAADLWGRQPEVGKDMWCGSWKIFELDGITQLPLDQCPMSIALKEKRKVICHDPLIVERPDGTRRYFIPHPEPMFNREGNLVGAVNMLIDVTEAKLSELYKAKLAAIIQTSNDAIISKTIEGIITSWNPAAEKLFGYSEKEIIGKQITTIIPPDQISEEYEIINRMKKGERISHYETKRINKKKSLIDVSLTISPIKDDRGNIIGISKIVRDITEQKALNEALRESELRLKTISNASPVGLWMTDVNAQNTFVNETWIQWTGIPFEQQLGTGWLANIVEEDKLKAPSKFWECLLKREKYSTEFRMIRADGQLRWCLTEGAPYYSADGTFAGYAGSVTDITEIKKLEERKDDFIKMASHELKTPVTSINGYVQLLSKIYDEANDEKFEKSKPFVKTSLHTITKQVAKLARLISELLDLSKIESGRLELNMTKFSIGELVHETIEDVRHTTSRHNIILQSNADGIIEGDRDRLSQVMLNLLTNAIKYSPEGGPIHVCVQENNNILSISVKDHGIGIDKKELPLIFQRFYRSEGKNEQTYPGFGIGLFIAYEIIQRHNGEICVESEKGEGSVFTVKLQLV